MSAVRDSPGRDKPYIGVENRACRDEVPVVFVVVHGQVREPDGDDDVPPHHLLEDRAGVRERVTIREFGEPMRPDDGVELRLRLLLLLRVHRHG